MHEKNFNKWHKKKRKLNDRKDSPFYNKREIWWCSIGVNVGVEMDGKGEEFTRPIVVLNGFNKQSFLGVALTGRKRTGEWYVYLGEVNEEAASANLSQVRIFDTKRLIRKIGMLEKEKFDTLVEQVRSVTLPK